MHTVSIVTVPLHFAIQLLTLLLLFSADNVRGMQVIKGFAAKSDGKDKLTALVQVRYHRLSEGSRRCVRAAASTT